MTAPDWTAPRDRALAELLRLLRLEMALRPAGRLCLYGAGKYADILCGLLADHGVGVSAFVVSRLDGNPPTLRGLPVLALDDLGDPRSALFLLALNYPDSDDVDRDLRRRGLRSFPVPAELLGHLVDLTGRYSHPTVEVTATLGCPVRCRYCPQDTLLRAYFAADPHRPAVMSVADFDAVLAKLPTDALLDFTGFVEPFQHPEAATLMRHAAARHPGGPYGLIVSTTLVGATPERLSAILGLPFRRFSLHLPDARGFARIPLTEDYFALLDTVLRATKADGSPFVDDASCQAEPHPRVAELLPPRLRVNRAMNDRAGNLPDEPLLRRHGLSGPLSCQRSASLDRFVLLPDGSLALCCNDYALRHVAGNLLRSTWDEVANGPEMAGVRRRMASDDGDVLCRNCLSARARTDLKELSS